MAILKKELLFICLNVRFDHGILLSAAKLVIVLEKRAFKISIGWVRYYNVPAAELFFQTLSCSRAVCFGWFIIVSLVKIRQVISAQQNNIAVGQHLLAAGLLAGWAIL